jgi:hypothetical protein
MGSSLFNQAAIFGTTLSSSSCDVSLGVGAQADSREKHQKRRERGQVHTACIACMS